MSRKKEIAKVAARLMSEKGYKATTLEDIAKIIGLDKSSLFHYFSGKSAILDMAVGKGLESATQRLKEIVDNKSLSPREKLKLAIENHVTATAENLDGIKLFFNEFRFFSQKKKSTFLKQRKDYESLFRKVVEETQKSGLFKDLPTKIVTLGILGMCNWMLTWYKNGPDLLSPAEIARIFYTMLMEEW